MYTLNIVIIFGIDLHKVQAGRLHANLTSFPENPAVTRKPFTTLDLIMSSFFFLFCRKEEK